MSADDRPGQESGAASGLTRRADGTYEQRLGDPWTAQYLEDPGSGLWRAELFRHDVPAWVSIDHESLDDAAQAVRDHLDQL